MFVTHVHCCFSHLFCPLYHFLIHSPPAAMFLSKWETIQLISSLRKKKTLGNLAFIFSFSFFFFCLFLLNNTVSCYLRAAADNMYFNFCSWHISSSTWNVCAAEHHILPWDGSPSGRIWDSKYLKKTKSCKLVSSLSSISGPMPSLQDFVSNLKPLFSGEITRKDKSVSVPNVLLRL